MLAACNRGVSMIKEPPSTTASFVWNPHAHCADCHASKVKSMADTTLLASKHAAAGNKCLDCHDAADLQTVHENVIATTPGVTKKKYPQAHCLKCHGSYTAIIELTKGRTRLNPHDSHYGEVECIICHNVHTAKSPDAFCVSCHITMN